MDVETLKKLLSELVEKEPEYFRTLILKGDGKLIREIFREALKDEGIRLEIARAVAGTIAIPINVATKEDIKRIEERMATREDLEKFATKEDIKRLEERMATKEDLERFATKEDLEKFATKEDLKQFATKQDLEKFATKEDLAKVELRLLNRIDALGARWGIFAEESFREGARALLRDAGWTAEKVMLRDVEGFVYGEPADVEYDVVVRDGKTIILEITSALKRSDLLVIRRKRELYEKAKGVKVNAVYVVTLFIQDKYPDRVIKMAKPMGIKVLYPAP